MITTVVFDLDDTLYSEVDYCRSGLRATAGFIAQTQTTALDQEEIFSALWDQFQRGNRTQTLNTALDVLGIPYNQQLIRSLVMAYRKHSPQIALPRENRRLLETLKEIYTLGLLTDGYLPAQRLKVQALKITKYFAHIIYTEQLGRQCWKPSPVGFQRLCDLLNTPPEQMVYVGDNPAKDFIAPNALGSTSIQVRRPDGIHNTAPAGEQARAGHVLESLSELPELLESLNLATQTS